MSVIGKIQPPLCESPVGLRPPGDSQSGIFQTNHIFSCLLNFLITFKYIWFDFPSHFYYTDIDLIFDEPADLFLG